MQSRMSFPSELTFALRACFQRLPRTQILGVVIVAITLVHTETARSQGAAILNGSEESDNCGVKSALALAEVFGMPVSAANQQDILDKYKRRQLSLSHVRSLTQQFGIPCDAFKATLDEVIDSLKPTIIHTKEPSHFSLLIDGRKDGLTRLLDDPAGPIRFVPTAELRKQYDGYCLIPARKENISDPRCSAIEPDYSVVDVNALGAISHTFKVQNTGKQPLELSIQAVSCGCTSASFKEGEQVDTVRIRPGQTESVWGRFSPQGAGSSGQTITIKTNDPLKPLLYLTMRVISAQGFSVSPSAISVTKGKGRTSEQRVFIEGAPDLTITELKTDVPGLETTLSNLTRSNDKSIWSLRLSIPAGLKVGSYTGSVTFSTNMPEVSLANIPVAIKVSGDISISPRTALFGVVDSNKTSTMEISIRAVSGKPFGILSARAEGPSRCKVLGPTDQGVVKTVLEITIPAGEPGVFRDTVLVRTDVPGEESITIPVTAIRARAEDR